MIFFYHLIGVKAFIGVKRSTYAVENYLSYILAKSRGIRKDHIINLNWKEI